MEIIDELQRILEHRLKQVIPAKTYRRWWDEHTEGINVKYWSEDWQTATNGLIEPMHAILTRGGKRWRSLAMMLSGLAFNMTSEEIIDLALLVEIPHNASLVIDDIEDNALLRRGDSSIHIIYGEDSSINSANFTYFAPLTLIDNLVISDNLKVKLYKTWHLGMRRVHMGQAIDISWHNNNIIPNQEEYEVMAKLKTGSLIVMGIELIAVKANLNEKTISLLQEIWFNIGLAFQVLDDALNILHGVKGKYVADDIMEGKKSLPVILYCLDYPEEATKLSQLLDEVSANNDKDKAERINSILVDSGVARQALDYGNSLLEQAIVALTDIMPNDIHTELLIDLLNNLSKKLQS